MEFYKIRNKDGLFYKSSYVFQKVKTIYFHKKGKEFKTLKSAKDCIENTRLKFPNDYTRFELQSCVIVKFKVNEVETINI